MQIYSNFIGKLQKTLGKMILPGNDKKISLKGHSLLYPKICFE